MTVLAEERLVCLLSVATITLSHMLEQSAMCRFTSTLRLSLRNSNRRYRLPQFGAVSLAFKRQWNQCGDFGGSVVRQTRCWSKPRGWFFALA